MPLQERKYGIRVTPIEDKTLISTASFVMAATSQVGLDTLRSQLPARLKIGSVERIRDLINLKPPGNSHQATARCTRANCLFIRTTYTTQ